MATLNHLGLFPQICVADIEDNPLFYQEPDFIDVYRPMTQKQAMALCWNVKKMYIRVRVAHIVQGEGIIQKDFEGEAINSFYDDYAPPEKESDLVCGHVGFYGLYDSESVTYGGLNLRLTDDYMVSENQLPQYDNESNSGIIKKDGNTFLPKLFFFWDWFDFSSMKQEGWNQVSGYSKIDLKSHGTLEWPVYGRTNSGFDQYWDAEVTEFWEYDPNDGGGPIYDNSTGARIRFDV